MHNNKFKNHHDLINTVKSLALFDSVYLYIVQCINQQFIVRKFVFRDV